MQHSQRILRVANSLRASLFAMVTCVDELCELVEQGRQPQRDSLSVVVQIAGQSLRVDRGTYTIHWKGRRCPLGCTMAFHVMERLARRPNEYVLTDRLLDDLWSGARAYSTVRSTVCRLKARLRREGMGDLAELIDGRTRGHYGLVLRDG